MTANTGRLTGTVIAALALAAGTAAGSTAILYGTVVDVDHETKSYAIFVDMYNYPDRGEGRLTRWNYTTPRLFVLDGEPSTAAATLAPGRAVMCLEKGNIVIASSDCIGPDADRQGKDPSNGIYSVSLGNSAVKLDVKDASKGTVQSRSYGLSLLVDVIDGKAVHGVGIAGRMGGRPYHDADVSGVTIKDQRMAGKVKVTLVNSRGPEAEPVTAEYMLDVQRKGSGLAGRFEGTCGDKAVSGRAGGSLLPRATVADPGRIWLRMVGPGISKTLFTVFDFRDGTAQPGGGHFWHKGAVNGRVTENTVRVDIGKRQVRGSLVSTITHHGEGEYRITIDAPILGNRWIFGTATVEKDGQTSVGHMRGGLVPADAPVQGLTPELSALYRETVKRK